jgi:hypothetical protein
VAKNTSKKKSTPSRAKSKKSIKGKARQLFKLSDKESAKIKGGKSKKSSSGFRFTVPH